MSAAVRIVLGGLAVALLATAGFANPAFIETTFLGESTGQLEWGPALFRALLGFHGLLCAAAALWPRAVSDAWEYRPLDDREPLETPVAHYAILAALVFFAILVRLIRIEAPLWLDEVFTLVDFGRRPLGAVLTDYSSQNQHMLYSLLMQGSMAVFGETPFALRLPAVVFGALTPVAIYTLGRRLIGLTPALAAAALVTFSYHHVWFSQNARGYTGALFFVLWSTHFWLLAQRRGGQLAWLGYVVVTVAALWTHATSIFVVAGQGAVWLGEQLRDRDWARARGALLAWVVAGSITLQLYALSLPSFFGGALEEFDKPTEWTSPFWALAEAVRGLAQALPSGLAWLGAALAIAGLAAAWLGWTGLLRIDGRAAWVMTWPAVLGAAVMLALGHNLWPRFFFFAFGFAVLIAVLGIYELVAQAAHFTGYVERARAWAPLLMVALVGASALTVPRNYFRPKQDFPAAQRYVEREAQPGEVRVSVGLAATVFSTYFAPYWANAEDYDEFSAARQNGSRTWVIYCMPVHMEAWHPRIWAEIERDFEPIVTFRGTLSGGEIYVARERGPESTPILPSVPRE